MALHQYVQRFSPDSSPNYKNENRLVNTMKNIKTYIAMSDQLSNCLRLCHFVSEYIGNISTLWCKQNVNKQKTLSRNSDTLIYLSKCLIKNKTLFKR